MKSLTKVSELIYWSYANLAMAHYCVSNNVPHYNRTAYSIRAKLYKGLTEGTMHIHSFFDDEKIKLQTGNRCVYCGCKENLSIDHIFPRALGGADSSDNLVCSCKSCNSSKGTKDLIQWFGERNEFPPLLLLRRYLKLVYSYCTDNNVMDVPIETIDNSQYPFNLKVIPVSFPQPAELHLI